METTDVGRPWTMHRRKCAGIDVEIMSPSLSVQTLFLLPVCVVAILRFPCRLTSGHDVSGISKSGMVEIVGVAAEIVSPSLSVQKLFILPVSSQPFLIPAVGIVGVHA